MNLTIIAIDKMKSTAPERTIIDTYIRQCGWKISIIELQADKGLNGNVRQEAESELLLKHIPSGAKIVVLDEHGQNLSSRQFASQLIEWRDRGTKDIVFLIGGADGHTDKVRQKADLI